MIDSLKKLNIFFDFKQKQKIAGIVFLMVCGALMETLSISLVVPMLSVIMDESFFETNTVIRKVCNVLRIESYQGLVIFFFFAMIAIFVLKNFFLYFEYNIQQKFICSSRMVTQKRLMGSFLQRPYEYYINESTANIMRGIISDSNNVFMMLIVLMSLFTEIIVSFFLMIAVVVIDVSMAVFICIILLLEILLITKKIKPIMIEVGERSRHVESIMSKWVIQAVEGIKETKVANKQQFFVSNYETSAAVFAQLERKKTVLAYAPRLIIEAVSVSAVFLFMIALLMAGRSVKDFLPQLGALALAAVRLLPSANRISADMNQLPYYYPFLEGLMENMEYARCQEKRKKEKTEASDRDSITLKHSCKLDNITYAYHNSSQNVLEDATLEIPVGSSVGIVGASGAGKTTVVDILLGLLHPQKGHVLSDGVDIGRNYGMWLSYVGYIPQNIFMLDDTIAANIIYGDAGNEGDEERIWTALREAQLEEFVRTLPDGIYTHIGDRGLRLSGGQRQRIGIARVLYRKPELIIFDEATSALDNETENAIMESINSLYGKKTMVIIAHRLTTIRGCDAVFRVAGGKIVREDRIKG